VILTKQKSWEVRNPVRLEPEARGCCGTRRTRRETEKKGREDRKLLGDPILRRDAPWRRKSSCTIRGRWRGKEKRESGGKISNYIKNRGEGGGKE